MNRPELQHELPCAETYAQVNFKKDVTSLARAFEGEAHGSNDISMGSSQS